MVDLLGLEGKKIWLIFYRYATCPLCNEHLSQIEKRYDRLREAGVEVIAVFDSPVPAFYAPGGRGGVRFPVIADPAKKLYGLYGTRTKLWGWVNAFVALKVLQVATKGFIQGRIHGDATQMPSHFLIDERGIIESVHHGRNAADHPSWAKIDRFARGAA